MSNAGVDYLDSLAAAYHLGITHELLFAYTSRRFRGPEGASRRLTPVNISGKTYFLRRDLDAFDHHLWNPWANETDPRSTPPRAIVDHLRAESRNQCVRCGSGIGVQTAHITPWAQSRCHHPHNLIRLCSACHIEHDEHHSLATEELRELKDRAIAATRAALMHRMAGDVISSPRPPSDALFAGRKADLIALRRILRRTRTTLVLGAGGIGKTQLLLHALAGMKTGRPVLWLDLERFSDIQGIQTMLYALSSGGIADDPPPPLAARLDDLNACVVLDGLEQLGERMVEAVDDLLAELQLRTSKAQFVITSQVDLTRTLCEARFRVGGLGDDASREVLRAVIAAQVPFDLESEKGVVDLCDGHPLALRLSASLFVHFGSGAVAFQRMRQRGTPALELQKRSGHDRHTSLGTCLGLAYDALDKHEQRLLFLLASAPAGLFLSALERDDFDAAAAAAGLRRWSLIQVSDSGEARERLHVLAPIGAYADHQWRSDNAESVLPELLALTRDIAVTAAVIDQRADDALGMSYMLARYSEELANFLSVFDAAERYPENVELALHAAGLGSVLMRFFFVLRLPEQGAALMRRAAELALRNGETARSADMILRMASLAARSDDPSLTEAAEALLGRLDEGTADSVVKGSIALCRALIACKARRFDDLTNLSREAISRFEAELRARIECGKDLTGDRVEELHNDLASAHGLLGDGLLHKEDPAAAWEAYQSARRLLRGGAAAVNMGQFLHQRGNCESLMGRHAEAMHSYRDAAVHFHAVGMKEYLSNAVGELGLTLTDMGGDARPPAFADDLLHACLDDVRDDTCRAFMTSPARDDLLASHLRKLFGVVILVSLTSQARALGGLSTDLGRVLLADAKGRTLPAGNSEAVFGTRLGHILRLAATIAAVDGTTISEGEVGMLAMSCCQQDKWSEQRRRSVTWLEMYLRIKCALSDVTADQLMRSALAANSGEPF